MAGDPEGSLPRRCGTWAATLGAYRLLNNARVEPSSLISGHVQQTRAACAAEAVDFGELSRVVLCLQDSTELEAVWALSPTKLIQHSALAVRPDGRVLGVLAGLWQDDPAGVKGKGRAARVRRPRRSLRWVETAQAVGPSPNGCRLIHVADREADDFQFYHACLAQGHGFLVRSQHNRYVNGDSDRLWPFMQQQACGGGLLVVVPRRKGQLDGPPRRWRQSQAARLARLTVSWATVQLQPPRNDPRKQDPRYHQPLGVYVVQVTEVDPPPGAGPLQWTLVTSEPVACLQQALFIVECYRQRWRIEEWHRAMKTGCRLEASQLHDADAFSGGVAWPPSAR